MNLSKSQKDALNRARDRAAEIRKDIEALTLTRVESGEQWGIAVDVTNLMYDLARELKADSR